ncbi:hypothetical protein F441_01205, partial [Phytophthora nicotianae CJ01A1]
AVRLLVFFLASANFVRASMENKNIASPNEISSNRAAAATRVLESHSAADIRKVDDIDEYEERGGLSKLVTLASKVNPSGTNAVLLGLNKRPDRVFTLFGVGKKLDNKQEVFNWLRFTGKYQAKHGGEDSFPSSNILSLLRSGEKADAKLALLIQSVKQVRDIKELGRNMEKALYSEWFAKKLRPVHIRKLLADSRGSAPDVVKQIVENYAWRYVKLLGEKLTKEELEKLGPPLVVVQGLLKEK